MTNPPLDTPLAWRSWPVVERPSTLLVVVPVVASALVAVVLFSGEPIWALGAAILMALGLREYFLPVRYQLDDHGATIVYFLWRRHLSWNRIRRVSFEERGVFLSPFPHRSRIENHRGLFLRYAGNRDAVAAAIERLRGEIGGAAS